jgi:hypothetical protein
MSKLNCDSLIRLDFLLVQNILTDVLFRKEIYPYDKVYGFIKKKWKIITIDRYLLTLIKEGICQEENNHLVKFAHILKFKIELNMKRFNIKSKHDKLMTENNNFREKI